jgi:hypothetical protein
MGRVVGVSICMSIIAFGHLGNVVLFLEIVGIIFISEHLRESEIVCIIFVSDTIGAHVLGSSIA